MEKAANPNSRRKSLFDSTLNAVEHDWADLGKTVQRQADRVLFRTQDNTELLIHLASVKQGYGFKAGEFGVYFSLIVCKGPVYDLMRKLRLLTGEESSDGRIFQAGSLNFPGGGLYELRSLNNPVEVAARIAGDIRKHMHPLAERILACRSDVLTMIVETPDAFEKPFGTAVALLALSGKASELESFWAGIEGNEYIWDRPDATELKALHAAVAKALK